MEHVDAQQLLQLFSEKHGLRYLEKSRHYLGVYEGLGIDAFESGGDLCLYFFSPTAHVSELILEDFAGFTHLAQTSIQTNWLKGRMLNKKELDRHGCTLQLGDDHLALIEEEDFLNLPDVLSKDFQTYGAAPQIDSCSLCGGAAPQNLLYANEAYAFACNSCFENLKNTAPEGKLAAETPIRWGHAAATLVVGSGVYAYLWGLLQQSQDGRVLLAAPLFGSVFFCGAVGRAAQGMNGLLRMLTIIFVLVSVLAGNIWGFRTAILKQAFVTWGEAIEIYFKHQLAENGEAEAWYFLGGLAGAWFGFGLLKSFGILKYE